MLALDNNQLTAIMTAASGLPPEKRSLFLERVAARLKLHGGRPSDAQLDKAIQAALRGLTHNATVQP